MAEIQLQGMPVWVYAKNIDDNRPVAPSRLINGGVGESYAVEPADLPGYQYVKSEGATSGVLDAQTHVVTFYYRPDSYLEAQNLEDKYLHIKTAVPVYDDFSTEPTTVKLWPGMVVKVVKRVATKDGTFWYQMADSRWVRFDMHEMALTNDDGQAKDPNGGWQMQRVWEPVSWQAQGTIDFVPGRTLNVYDQPYGQVIGTIENQVPVQITEQVTDDADNIWYHLDQMGWVASIYVHIGQ
ncbi:hypothetical protein JOC36_000370 [Weissella uvarum]|uniref:MucBP domain-containing protein n=1 Tax=Weissella uvarum TaxID=1479233 RepID=UPI001960CEE2|nr:MucBP domain-containing protein [Weissella uvarum]MBM7616837.1 hypothetical protein [Weissella uvarum]MCM0594711.1 MucBP domain-containing protein [Weissella uvarum]